MKNLHLIATDNKYSRLYFNVNDKEFQICEIEKPSTILKPNRHIYITSDEKPKVGDWIYDNEDKEINFIKDKEYLINILRLSKNRCKKVILTTDQDLIKDGVQSIDDEFLDWFVKNPSCEEIEVLYDYFQVDQNNPVLRGSTSLVKQHKIIIPKEEPKQETLEEAAERLYKKGCNITEKTVLIYRRIFIDGAKWKQERSYSEEDMKIAFRVGFNVGYNDETSPSYLTAEKFIEQFKKK